MATEPASICVSDVFFRILKGRWAPSVLLTIADHGPIHFLALGRKLPGISRKVLSEQLRYLVRSGVVLREPQDDRQEVIYRMSEQGWELKHAVDGLNSLATRWNEHPSEVEEVERATAAAWAPEGASEQPAARVSVRSPAAELASAWPQREVLARAPTHSSLARQD